MGRFCLLKTAIAEAVRDGDVVAMEGFTHLIPFAAAHEVIRQALLAAERPHHRRLPRRRANRSVRDINTTVVGRYESPTVRLPGAGGAPEMAMACQRIFVVIPHSTRAMVGRLDFVTSLGHGSGGDSRARQGITTAGPAKVITDLCVMEPDPATRELTVTSVHPGVTRDRIQAATAWQIRIADSVTETAAPSTIELEMLRRVKLSPV
jgi:hypothetical protein